MLNENELALHFNGMPTIDSNLYLISIYTLYN